MSREMEVKFLSKVRQNTRAISILEGTIFIRLFLLSLDSSDEDNPHTVEQLRTLLLREESRAKTILIGRYNRRGKSDLVALSMEISQYVFSLISEKRMGERLIILRHLLHHLIRTDFLILPDQGGLADILSNVEQYLNTTLPSSESDVWVSMEQLLARFRTIGMF